LLQHARPLSDGQFDSRSVLDRRFELRASPTETIAGVEQAIDHRPVARPFLDFVEHTAIGVDGAISLLVDKRVVGRIGHDAILRADDLGDQISDPTAPSEPTGRLCASALPSSRCTTPSRSGSLATLLAIRRASR
jgi:hypothetical protein